MEQIAKFFIVALTASVLRYFVIAGLTFFLFYKLFYKRLTSYKIQKKEAAKADFIRDILHSLQTTLVFAAIACVVFLTPVKQITQIPPAGEELPLWWVLLSVPLSLLVHDAYFYWMHRLLHHPALFRHTHLLHHKSTNPSPWSSYSFHFLEAVAEGLVLFVVVAVMPMNAVSISLFILAGFVINVYGHLGYEIAPLWLRKTWLFELVNTSVHHNFHHSKFKGNYGLYLRFWDRTMGTEHPDYVKEYDRVQAQRIAAKQNAGEAANQSAGMMAEV
ncbi:sterol desaturase family protein [Mucilaginibacter terrenus]|uniref:Sterol desaturase family protein n=1 Tax=Mucilaginibacter terrenus TaxID=2482727 RepID=A0A3E2NJW6_9SPHI|nr:sterol desaturase family protein [Mucilaginibacter terrenus]RFZ81231.1 sterol desaturase family protein [Mucilaginibacter terrenus]